MDTKTLEGRILANLDQFAKFINVLHHLYSKALMLYQALVDLREMKIIKSCFCCFTAVWH